MLDIYFQILMQKTIDLLFIKHERKRKRILEKPFTLCSMFYGTIYRDALSPLFGRCGNRIKVILSLKLVLFFVWHVKKVGLIYCVVDFYFLHESKHVVQFQMCSVLVLYVFQCCTFLYSGLIGCVMSLVYEFPSICLQGYTEEGSPLKRMRTA